MRPLTFLPHVNVRLDTLTLRCQKFGRPGTLTVVEKAGGNSFARAWPETPDQRVVAISRPVEVRVVVELKAFDIELSRRARALLL